MAIGKDHIPGCIAQQQATGFYLWSDTCPGCRQMRIQRAEAAVLLLHKRKKPRKRRR